MRRNRSFIAASLLTLAGFGFTPSLHAEDIYIAQTSHGSDSGRDAANAHSVAFFNTSRNWKSPKKVAGKIGPGDTVHLVGTITTALTVQASGTATGAITILFDRNAKMSAPYWNGSAIRIPKKDYITIDGGATGTIGGHEGKPEQANGIIECTDNGTQRSHQVHSTGVSATECNALSVKNLVISNLYVRTRGSEQKAFGAGISNSNTNGHGISDYSVTNCIIHDAYIGINSDYGIGDHDYEFSYNTVYNCNWGIKNSDRGSKTNTMSGLVVHHNWLHDWKNWDDTAKNSFHHNGFFAYANQGTLNRPIIHSNVFGPGFGGRFQTAGIYINTGIIEPLVYNNLFVPGPGEGVGNGFITVGSQRDTTLRIYNNSLVSLTGTGTFIQLNGNTHRQVAEIKNNLSVGASTLVALYNRKNITLISDYNLGFALGITSAFKWSLNSSAAGNTISEWLAWGYDTHGVFADPMLDHAYRPAAGSPAINAGADLSEFFTTDRVGTPRLKGKPWTIGASTSSTVAPPPAAAPPSLVSGPADQTVHAGTTVSLTVATPGTPAPTYQWYRNGVVLSGQTSATLKLTSVNAANAGTYTVVAKNSAGSVTSKGAVVTVQVPPTITTQPKSQTIDAAAAVTFTAAASGTPAPTYQWKKNGVAISGATSATLKLTKVATGQAGSYTVVAKNAAGSVTSKAALLTVNKVVVANPPVTPPTDSSDDKSGSAGAGPASASNAGHFSNLSVRAAPGTASETLIVGFVLASGKKRVLVRAVGPSLSSITELKTFPDPHLTLYAGNALTASNAGWGGSEIMRKAFAEVGAFPLEDKSTDAAILTTLAPKAYTAVVSGTGTGIVLAEIYDADPAADPARRLINLSVRAHVGKGDDVLIAGFVVDGESAMKVLIRAVGPSLSKLGVTGALVDPQLELFQKDARIGLNDNWGGGSTLSAAFQQTGAFALTGAKSKDAALIVTLKPGAYTAVVSGVNGTTGNALVEAYEVR